MDMSATDMRIARCSLVIVWLWTALVSAGQVDGASRDLLRANPEIPTALYPWLIWSGATTDLVLGLWMLFQPSRAVYLGALGVMLLMTLVATWVDPTLWLHPLGPISKNLPIAALLWLLARKA
jgi:hypothetical protein